MVKTDDYIRKRKDLRQAHGQNNASGGERKKKKRERKKISLPSQCSLVVSFTNIVFNLSTERPSMT